MTYLALHDGELCEQQFYDLLPSYRVADNPERAWFWLCLQRFRQGFLQPVVDYVNEQALQDNELLGRLIDLDIEYDELMAMVEPLDADNALTWHSAKRLELKLQRSGG